MLNLLNSVLEKISNIILESFSILIDNFYYLFFIGTFLLSLRKIIRGQLLIGLCWFILGCFWLLLFDSNIFYWISSLGQDSFTEARDFAPHEALAWLVSLPNSFDYRFSIRRFILFSFVSLTIFIILKIIQRYLANTIHKKTSSILIHSFAGLLLLSGFVSTSSNILISISNNTDFIKTIKNNFIDLNEASLILNDGPNLVIHIGESTTSMNMGLYGYFRNTTPNLSRLASNDERFFYFKNVFSTHVHTTPTLLEALSFDMFVNDINNLPPEERKMASVADILNSNELIDQALLTNQGRTGSWNTVSSIVLNSIQDKIYGDDGKNIILGNLEPTDYKPKDHELFEEHFVPLVTSRKKNSRKVIYIHGYAGHSPYLDFLPMEFRGKVDDFFSSVSTEAISDRRSLGKKALIAVEEYDSTIRYVDYIVSERIKDVEALDEPYVYIFFSDHGEAVYTPTGHDSSRFEHEMARIPYIVFFNTAAQTQFPDLFKKYSNLSKTNSPATLGQLSSTFFDILNVDNQNLKDLIFFTPVIGEKTNLSNILVRRVGNDIRHVPLSKNNINTNTQSDWFNYETRNFVLNNSSDKGFITCHHGANSISQILRAKITSNCIEIDLVISDAGDLQIFHPPSPSTGMTMDFIFHNFLDGIDNVWIDAKNIDNPKNCSVLQDFLQNQKYLPKNLLVEFPSNSVSKLSQLNDCFNGLKELGIYRSFYVPTEIALECTSKLKNGYRDPKDINQCLTLSSIIQEVEQSENFTDLGFDYAAREAIEFLKKETGKLTFNSWHIPTNDVINENFENYIRVILKRE